MKIWLDDDRDPKDPFIQKEFGAESNMIWVKTAQDAIDLLNRGNVTFISLDHDLGPGDGTGYQVATWIEQHSHPRGPSPRIPRLLWKIHTQNVIGRMRMQQALTNADRYWSHNE